MRPLISRTLVASALPLLVLLVTGLRGIDFGHYWDDEAMFTKVRRALASPPTLLPDAYDYPSVTFWVSLASLAPDAMRDPKLRFRVPDTHDVIAATTSERYLLRTRALFLAISSLAVIWTAGLSLAIGATVWEAAVAAAILAASWEVDYHLRWIAPDGMTMMFATLAVFASVVAVTRRSRAWCGAAAIAVGFATGTKYSAWVLVLPLAIAAWTIASAGPLQRAASTIKVLAASVVAYLVTTPGTLLQPTIFVGAVRGQVTHYASGHDIYTIAAGPTHVWRMLEYAGAVLLSPYVVVALGTSLAALAGAAALVRRQPLPGVIILSFPVVYIAYFALQRVMIVRNLIILAPFLAVLAARGIAVLMAAASSRVAVQAAAAAAVAMALGVNVWFEARAAERTRVRNPGRTVAEFASWLDDHSAAGVQMTERLRSALKAAGHDQVPGGTSAAFVAFYALEPPHLQLQPNQYQLFAATFGPEEVNLNYYPDWIGDEHIVVLTREQAARFGVTVQ